MITSSKHIVWKPPSFYLVKCITLILSKQSAEPGGSPTPYILSTISSMVAVFFSNWTETQTHTIDVQCWYFIPAGLQRHHQLTCGFGIWRNWSRFCSRLKLSSAASVDRLCFGGTDRQWKGAGSSLYRYIIIPYHTIILQNSWMTWRNTLFLLVRSCSFGKGNGESEKNVNGPT